LREFLDLLASRHLDDAWTEQCFGDAQERMWGDENFFADRHRTQSGDNAKSGPAPAGAFVDATLSPKRGALNGQRRFVIEARRNETGSSAGDPLAVVSSVNDTESMKHPLESPYV